MREEGSAVHEAFPSVNLLLLKETLTMFASNPLLAASPDNFFPTDVLGVLDLLESAKSPFTATFLVDI